MRLYNWLAEHFVNAFDAKTKEKWADDVWDILQKSYAYCGGIKGSGFSSKEDMVRSIPFWKVATIQGKPVAVVMYKDKNGRKCVAGGTDGSREGKLKFKEIFLDDIIRNRAYSEISDKMLDFAKRQLPNLENFLIPADQVSDILKEPVTPTGKFTYIRNIGGEPHEKVMYGKPGIPIKVHK